MTIVTQTQLENASADALTLEAFVNGPDAVLTSRLGTSVKSLQKIIAESALAAASFTTTSVSSVAIGTGAKTFTVASGKSFTAGQFLQIASSANPANYMHGTVTSYTGSSLVMNITDIGGSGTFASWNIAMSGTQGPTGATGSTGAAGAGVYKGGTAGGTANALTFTSSPAISAYTDLDNSLLIGKILSDNTSATVTVQVSGVASPPTVKKFIGASKVALAIGDLQADMLAEFSRDGTDLILLNPRTNSKGATVASASTLDLNTTTGDYVQVSGTTTVTAITLEEGRRCITKFDGALVLTNGASLKNLSGANITTAADDVAEWVGEASGVVRMVRFERASGVALISSSNSGFSFDPANYAIGYMGKEPTRVDKTSNFQLENSIGCGGSAGGTGAKAANSGAETLSLETGTTSTGYSALYANFQTDPVAPAGNGFSVDFTKPAKFSAFAYGTSLSDGTNTFVVQLGFGYSGDADVISAAMSGGNVFRYKHSESSGNIQCVTHDGTASTITNTGIPWTTSAESFLFEVNINATWTAVEFKINGTVVATHTTNIYKNQRAIFSPMAGIIKSAGTTNRGIIMANYAYQLGVRTQT